MSVGGYIRICLAVYGPEIIGGFGLEEKTKAVCGLGRTNYGGLRNVRPPIIDPPKSHSQSREYSLALLPKFSRRKMNVSPHMDTLCTKLKHRYLAIWPSLISLDECFF